MSKVSKIKKQVIGMDQAAGRGVPGAAGPFGTARIQLSIVAAFVAVLTIAVYLPALQNGFVWDDVQYITRNSFIRSLNGNLFKSAFLGFQADNWHPLTWISHAIDYSLWGLNPFGHHLTNIILHAFNTMMVVLLLMQLVRVFNQRETSDRMSGPLLSYRQALIASGVSGLLFGLHPLHVESVAWISERKDLLCALFFLMSIMSYVNYAGVRDNRATQRNVPSPWFDKRYLFALGFFALALMSKPMAVTLPVVLLILDWFLFSRIHSPRTFWTAFVEKLPFFSLTLISSVLTVLAQKAGGAMEMMQPVPLSTRVLVGARSLIAYVGKMIVPVNLVPYYPYPDGVSLLSPEYLSSIVLVIGITLLCVIIAKRQKLWLSAWGYFVVTLLPVLGIVQVGNQAMADRYTYLPSLGPFFVIGLIVAVLFEKIWVSRPLGLLLKMTSAVAAVFLFTSLSYATIQQIGVWRNNIIFWNYVITKGPKGTAESPKSAMAHNSLGLAYASQGQWDPATAEFQTALRLKPDYVEPHYNLGVAYASLGQLDRAIAEYQTALRMKPDSAGAHNNLGIAYASLGQFDRAIAEFQRTSLLNPDDAEPHSNLGIAYASQGQWDRAIAEFQTALRLNPYAAKPHYDLGNAYASQGQWDSAIAEFQTALRLKPDFHEAGQRLNDIISRRR
jgi:Flp pilus assembly protein TadD